MIALRLLPAGADEFSSDNGLEAATSVSGPDGSFQFFGVPPGPHTLVASRVPRPPAGPSSMTTVIQFGRWWRHDDVDARSRHAAAGADRAGLVGEAACSGR